MIPLQADRSQLPVQLIFFKPVFTQWSINLLLGY